MTAPSRRCRPPRKPPFAIGLALAALMPILAGCGSDEDKAASAAARAFEALGLHGMSWDKARLDGGSLVLLDARADLDGAGRVHASEVVVTGFREADGGWQADSVRAERVDGAVRARRLTVQAPRARRESGAWTVRDDGRVVESYEGPVAGMPVGMASGSVGPAPRIPGRPDAIQVAAAGLRLPEGVPAPLSALSGLDWDVSVRSEAGRDGEALVEVQRAEAKGWSVRGRIVLSGGAGLPAALARIEPAALLDAGRWPEGVLLREADLDMTLSRPDAFLGKSAPDPIAGSMAAKVAAGGLVSWHVRMRPAQPVAVRQLPGILAARGADARLGLDAQVRDVLVPSNAAAVR